MPIGSSVLPVAFHNNQLYFLFGKENPYADTPGWSDFGGGIEHGETPHETAMREAAEELTGFLGDTPTVKRHIKSNGGLYKINNADKYHIHIFKTEYDRNLPVYYNRNHAFLWKKMDEKAKHSVIFEKIEVAWMTISDMKKNRNTFRPFYREYLDRIIAESKDIKQFVCRNRRYSMNTRAKSLKRKSSKNNNGYRISNIEYRIPNADRRIYK